MSRSANRIAFLSAIWLLVVAVAPAAAATPRAATSAAPGTDFVLPLPPPPVVLTPFAPPQNRYGAGHRGVDLAADVGAVVTAAGAGRVVFAGELAGRGVVSVEHDGGLRTTYEPVTSTVTVGSAVAAGAPIGTLQAGHPGCAPTSCLHWGARLPGEVYIDPMALLRGWQVRLWPWEGR
jgi:murein DD-endopeptidase MepM/ murein hydrolase activator NlpD